MGYRGYTDEQVQSMSNGCGPQSGFFSWVKPPHRNFFKEACDYHDVDYKVGGTEKERLKADLNMKRRMDLIIKRTPKDELIEELYTKECGIPNWLINLLPRAVIIKIFKIWALVYWKAVIIGGKSSWNYTD